MKLRVKPLLGGLVTLLVPPLADVLGRRNYPRVTAQYYYTVWLRHVCTAHHFHCWYRPATVLEIGPGNSLGTGLAALLSGAQQYIGYDAHPLLHAQREEQLLSELEQLFRRQAAFAETDPLLPSTAFPAQLLSAAFPEPWLARIKASLATRSDLLRYVNEPTALVANSVDHLFSHSVLEHVEALESLYAQMWHWLKPGGFMTHSIDFTSHGVSPLWNGHWTISEGLWKLMKGKRHYFLNRVPASTHQALLTRAGFVLEGVHLLRRASDLTQAELAPRFRYLSEADLTTTTAFLVARKPC